MKTFMSKHLFTIFEIMIVSVVAMGIIALFWPSATDYVEHSRDEATIEQIIHAENEAKSVFESESSASNDCIYVSYPDKVGDDGHTKAMIVVKDIVAKGTKQNDFSGLAEEIPHKLLFHGTMEQLDNAKGKSYVIEFKYNQSNQLYIIQAFEQDRYNVSIFE
ncbi:hypothetical protein SAMN05421767_1153 [Granulicatella balaenopterae]|uniref:Uncharacterized protein n=1 Tax=Granulicatella balaenopterae TaxID=137733 RepID=A0A1H9KPZ8_9LACT|nr:hypothetical protein [Granulicatella balaenopterae]SER01251.1 hypothetical protein SAMN05421767_1153 [Granulicatella balaenopterae]